MRGNTLSSIFFRSTVPGVLLLIAAGLGPVMAADSPIEDSTEFTLDAPAAEQPRSPISGLCPSPVELPQRMVAAWAEMGQRETPEDPAAEPPVHAQAEHMALQREGVSRLEGDVWLRQGEHFMSTEALEFNQDSGVVRTLAPSRFGSRELIVDSETAVYDTSIGQGHFGNVDFYLLGRGGRGEADVLARTGETTSRLEGVKYTTCAPDDEDWWLKASSMDIDRDEGMGVGRNVRIAFMGVPFFYVPWISFPIDERRKTGFLFPEFGDSGRNGAWLRTPYYLNLAPNYDATLTPYYMAERGTMLEGQFRYLFGWGTGELDASYLGEDRLTGSHRYHYRYRHASALPAGWRFGLDYRQVSDEEYFQDFSTSGNATLISHIAQVATLQKGTLEYGASIRLQRYQTVDPTIAESRRPYEKWPEIDYYYTPLPLGDRLWFTVEGESVNFQRDDRVSGWRHHTETTFSADFGNPGLRLTPRLAWWQTEYDLQQPDDSLLDLGRGVPVTSVDLLARFRRPLASGGSQTLEPRLFYLHVPYRNQDNIPLFDTRNSSDTLASLFRDNRFTGPDRVGDENRISAGLTTRFTRPDGREWFSAAIARAWHLDDRRVGLTPAAEPATETASNYYGAIEYRPTAAHSLQLDLGWRPENDRIESGAIQYQFSPAYETIARVAYRYRRLDNAPLEQVDVAFATPVGGRWNIFGRAVYSLEEDRSQETLAGFEYETCCWAFRAFNRRYIFNRQGEFNQSFWFQLELKGLSSVGRRIDDFLATDIYGYGETP